MTEIQDTQAVPAVMRQALEDAATSLETVAKNAGHPYDTDGYENLLEHHDQVRGYAASRARAAREALAALAAPAPQAAAEHVRELEDQAYCLLAILNRFGEGATVGDVIDALERLSRIEAVAKRLVSWLLCMSYNDSYFGEPAGYLKQCVNELRHLLPRHGLLAAPTGAAPADNWRQYATEREDTAQQVIERHRGEHETLLRLLAADRKTIAELRAEAAPAQANVARTAPKSIYLVIGEGCPPEADFTDCDEVTWCKDKIDANSIKYVRADLAAQPQTKPASPAQAAAGVDVPNTFKLPGETDDQWLDRITGASQTQAAAPAVAQGEGAACSNWACPCHDDGPCAQCEGGF